MALEPMYLKGSEIQVGDIICERVGNQMRELFVVDAVSSATIGDTVWFTAAGGRKSEARRADDRVWVLATR